MSQLQYYAYDPVGKKLREDYHYSQAVRIPAGTDRVELSGQGKSSPTPYKNPCPPRKNNPQADQHPPGGWDPTTFAIPDSVAAQIEQAFSNVELALKDAGVKEGWGAVFRITSYHVGLEGNDHEVLELMVENFKRVMPNHSPIWTLVGVPALALKEMKVEIEVVAFDGK